MGVLKFYGCPLFHILPSGQICCSGAKKSRATRLSLFCGYSLLLWTLVNDVPHVVDVAATYFGKLFAESGAFGIKRLDHLVTRRKHRLMIGSGHRLQFSETAANVVRGPTP